MQALDLQYARAGETSDPMLRYQWAIRVALCAKLGFLVFFAFNTQFVMDEFWQFGQSKYLGNGFFDTIWPSKAVGYAVFYKPAHWLGWDAESAIMIGRLQTALLACGTLALLYGIARKLGQDRVRALLVVLLALSFSTFIERVFRTRSESLALFFATAALYWIVSRDISRAKTILIAGLFSGLAFIATQKAVYFNLALGLGLVVEALLRLDLLTTLRRGLMLVAGWVIPILVYSIALGGWDSLTILTSLFQGPLRVATSGHVYYTTLGMFYGQTIERNLLPYLLAAFGLLASLYRWRTLTPRHKVALVFTLVMIVLIARHNQPWPYVFIMVIPFLCLWAPVTLGYAARGKLQARLIHAVWIVAVLLSFVRNITYIEHDNRAEIDLIRQVETLLGPNEKYFDGIGMLSNHAESQRRWLDTRQVHIANSEGEASDFMRKLRAVPPHLIIDTYRTQKLRELMKPFLENSYVRVAPNIGIPGVRFSDVSEVTFETPLEQEFGLFDKSGQPVAVSLLVEDEPVQLPVLLQPGPNRVRLDGVVDWPVFLLPAHKPYSGLHPIPAPEPIFIRVYDY
ncbi:hypothetical protein [Roseibium sp. RKSG952]|uniref:DUF7055 domain-containing protein n=1 Tax=Roseibium sp. RKSG952 TaxID=2529384 RepID=UPI0012BBEF61|nr:hypothetical protein [Roseibium sp. RKSG952]MTI02420.1 hypothetical protein [Roseibium sp. RKSG952]